MALTELEQEVLEFMANGTEPTWLFLQDMPELHQNRSKLERILEGFESAGLATRTRKPSCRPGPTFADLDDWWALTPTGKAAVRP